MALLDWFARNEGVDTAKIVFSAIRDLQVWWRGADILAVTRTFQRVFRGSGKGSLDPETGRISMWTSTIAQRELVMMRGEMSLALGPVDDVMADGLSQALSAINYFGRRGSFLQLVALRQDSQPPDAVGFTNLSQPLPLDALGKGYLQRMDDMLPNATWDDVDNVNNPKSKGGRFSYNVLLPYTLRHHAFNHSVYALEGIRLQ